MALEPKDINEERLLALSVSIWKLMCVQQYILKQLPLDNTEPHQKHIDRCEAEKSLDEINNQMYRYFLGD